MILYHLFRALDWTNYLIRRYLIDPVAWLLGFIYFVVVSQIMMVVNWIIFAFLFVMSRVFFAVGWTLEQTLGSRVVTTAVATAGEAQGRAVEFGARQIFAVADAPVWKRAFFFLLNSIFRVGYAFGLARVWIWEKTVGSRAAQIAVVTAEEAPKRAIGLGLHQLDSVQDTSLGRLFHMAFLRAGRPFDGLIQFFLGWILTRNFRQLWSAVPVALLAAPFLYVAIKVPFTSIESRADAYRGAAELARQEGEEAKASLFERKLAQMNVPDAGYDFRRAIVNEATNGVEKTYAEMLRLAPHDSSGFPRAHRWIAIAIAGKKIKLDDGFKLRETVVHHLNEYLSEVDGDPVALQLMAELKLKNGKKEESVAYLKRVDTSELSAIDLVRLASSYRRAGDEPSAQRLADQAVVKFEQIGNSGQTAKGFLHWAAAHRILGDYTGLANVLADVGDNLPDKQRIPFVSIGVRAIKGSWTPKNPDNFYFVSRQVIRAFPKDETIADAIVDKCRNIEIARGLTTNLANEIRDGLVPASLLSRIGDLYAAEGERVAARKVYTWIHELDPTDVRITNNLAWLWATTKPRDMRVAMSYANEAVGLDQNCAYALETRGQVLFLLKRYSEAEKDLTKALNGLPKYAPIHTTLAKCYARLGDRDLATKHAQTSKRLERAAAN